MTDKLNTKELAVLKDISHKAQDTIKQCEDTLKLCKECERGDISFSQLKERISKFGGDAVLF